jgi:single-strand DNA-binding protein
VACSHALDHQIAAKHKSTDRKSEATTKKNGKEHMSDLNITTLTGRLVETPDLRYGNSGTAWGMFTLASNYVYKDKTGARQQESAFLDCKAFGGWAKSLAKHDKGDMALVSGRLRTETWEKDGRRHSKLTLICDSVRFVLPQHSSNGDASVEEEAGADVTLTSKDGKPPF